MGCIESIMEHIAYVVNTDAIKVKMNNLNTSKYPKITEFWSTMQMWGETDKRKAECKSFNEVRTVNINVNSKINVF